ncbi:hypothetical protein SOPP22_03750 [Shewanella sp. OPT22]|nr:hypothetical protein SOPP22_03750 [Shewanella sp. OPT22]
MDAPSRREIHQDSTLYSTGTEVSGSRKLRASNGQTYTVERTEACRVDFQSKRFCKSIHPISYKSVKECSQTCSGHLEKGAKKKFEDAIQLANQNHSNQNVYIEAVLNIMDSLQEPSKLEVVEGSLIKRNPEKGHSLILNLPNGESVVLAEFPLGASSDILQQLVSLIPDHGSITRFEVSPSDSPVKASSQSKSEKAKSSSSFGFISNLFRPKDKPVAKVTPFNGSALKKEGAVPSTPPLISTSTPASSMSTYHGSVEDFEIIGEKAKENIAPDEEPMELGVPEGIDRDPLGDLPVGETDQIEPMEVDLVDEVYSPDVPESYFIYPPGIHPEKCLLTNEQREEVNAIRLGKAIALCDQSDLNISLNYHIKDSLTVLFEDTDPVRKLIVASRLEDISEHTGIEVEIKDSTQVGGEECYIDINISIKGILFTVRVPHTFEDCLESYKVKNELQDWADFAEEKLSEKYLAKKQLSIKERSDYQVGDEDDIDLTEQDEIRILTKVETMVSILATLFTKTEDIEKLIGAIELHYLARNEGIRVSTHAFVDNAGKNRVSYRVSSEVGQKEIALKRSHINGIPLNWQPITDSSKGAVVPTIEPLQQRWVAEFDKECRKVLCEFKEDFITEEFATLAELSVGERAIWGALQRRTKIYEDTMQCIKTLFGNATIVEKHLAAMELESLGDTIAAMIEVYEIRTRAYKRVYSALSDEGVSINGAQSKMYPTHELQKVREIVQKESKASFIEYVRHRRGEQEGIHVGGTTLRNQNGSLKKMTYSIRLRDVKFPAEIMISGANTKRELVLCEGVAKRSRQFREERVKKLFPEGLPQIP